VQTIFIQAVIQSNYEQIQKQERTNDFLSFFKSKIKRLNKALFCQIILLEKKNTLTKFSVLKYLKIYIR